LMIILGACNSVILTLTLRLLGLGTQIAARSENLETKQLS